MKYRAADKIYDIAEQFQADPKELWKVMPLLVDFVWPETRGRKRKVTPEVLQKVEELTQKGLPKHVAAELQGVHPDTIRRHRKKPEK